MATQNTVCCILSVNYITTAPSFTLSGVSCIRPTRGAIIHFLIDNKKAGEGEGRGGGGGGWAKLDLYH